MANHHMPAPIICFVLRTRLLDNRVQLGGQEPIDVVRPGDRFRFGAAVAAEFGRGSRMSPDTQGVAESSHARRHLPPLRSTHQVLKRHGVYASNSKAAS